MGRSCHKKRMKPQIAAAVIVTIVLVAIVGWSLHVKDQRHKANNYTSTTVYVVQSGDKLLTVLSDLGSHANTGFVYETVYNMPENYDFFHPEDKKTGKRYNRTGDLIFPGEKIVVPVY